MKLDGTEFKKNSAEYLINLIYIIISELNLKWGDTNFVE